NLANDFILAGDLPLAPGLRVLARLGHESTVHEDARARAFEMKGCKDPVPRTAGSEALWRVGEDVTLASMVELAREAHRSELARAREPHIVHGPAAERGPALRRQRIGRRPGLNRSDQLLFPRFALPLPIAERDQHRERNQ